MKSTNLLFPAPPASTVPLQADPRHFPVRRIYCVGRNYAEHIREMGGDEREQPFFFQKPADAVVHDGGEAPYPSLTADFQYEVELILAIGRGGVDIPAEQAHEHVCGLGVGIDLTRRDLQLQARKTGRPWEIGKSFDHSAPCSALQLSHGKALPTKGRLALHVNGIPRQEGDLGQMIWSAAEIVSQLSRQYRLYAGDLIFTGTPAGVGPIQAGDELSATLEDIASLHVRVAKPSGLVSESQS